MPAPPNSFDDAAFSATAWTQLIDGGPNPWRKISISNLADQDLLVGFGATDDGSGWVIPSNSAERPFVVRPFTEVWGKLAAAGSGRVTINVG